MNRIVPVVIEDAHRDDYLDALKAYRERNDLSGLVRLFEKSRRFIWRAVSTL